MHEEHSIEITLKNQATEISSQLGGPPVIIIVGGSGKLGIPRTMTSSSIQGEDVRLRDLLGILEVSKQIETWKHLYKGNVGNGSDTS